MIQPRVDWKVFTPISGMRIAHAAFIMFQTVYQTRKKVRIIIFFLQEVHWHVSLSLHVPLELLWKSKSYDIAIKFLCLQKDFFLFKLIVGLCSTAVFGDLCSFL